METCQTCGQQFQIELMYSHRLECKEQFPDPNHPQIKESIVVNQNQGRFIQKSQNQSQVPSMIKKYNQIPSDSIIRSYQTKCDFCQLEFPNEIMQEHLEACDEKKSIEQLQFSFYDNGGVSFIQPQQHQSQQQVLQGNLNNSDVYNFDDEDEENENNDNQDNNSNHSNPNNYQTVTIQHLGPQGRVITRYERRGREQEINNSEQNEENEFNSLMSGMLFSNQFFRSRQHQPLQFLSFLRLMGKRGMQEKEIQNLNSIKYVPSANLSDEHKKCSICITDYQEGEVLILLPCTHRYHSECIGNWLKSSQACPICKHDIRNE